VNVFTEDGFLGGRVRISQPARGFRAGLDAVMLAAAVPAAATDTVLELGAGAGTASLCLAARVPDCTVIGVEIDAALVRLANANAQANASRVEFREGDAMDLPKALRKSFDHVFCNPPFHDGAGERSPDGMRAHALHDEGNLADWLKAGLKRTAAHGSFTVILRADRLAEALAALPRKGVVAFPLWPKAGVAAKRVILQLRPGKQAPFVLSAGLVLHKADGTYTEEAQAILRDAACLALAKPRL
jgi:tRNA1(Val) A37 N6-methylase TrmN6